MAAWTEEASRCGAALGLVLEVSVAVLSCQFEGLVLAVAAGGCWCLSACWSRRKAGRGRCYCGCPKMEAWEVLTVTLLLRVSRAFASRSHSCEGADSAQMGLPEAGKTEVADG